MVVVALRACVKEGCVACACALRVRGGVPVRVRCVSVRGRVRFACVAVLGGGEVSFNVAKAHVFTIQHCPE